MNNDIVFETRIEKARNMIRLAVTKAITEYQLPGVMIELVVESVLSDMRQNRISFMAEGTTLKEQKAEEKENTDG